MPTMPTIHSSSVLVRLLVGAVAALSPCAAVESPGWTLACADGVATVRSAAGGEVLHYLTNKPAGSQLSANSTCSFHPFTTPAGHAVTAFAPDDHRHHRGIFLAWVEMHGAVDADFWGWGAHAPVAGRQIVNRSLTALPDAAIGFTAVNAWMADSTMVLEETLSASLRRADGANVLDLSYNLVPVADVTLTRWAFSGFCVRYPKLGEVVLHDPRGVVTLPDPGHDRPDSNWPDAPWYAATWIADGAALGVAVVPRGPHPAQSWHNPRGIRMLNPAITGPAAVILKAGTATRLAYTVVAFDGVVPTALLNRLAE